MAISAVRPPVELHGNETVQAVMLAGILAAIAAATIWALWRRQPMLVLLMAGATLTSFVEPQLDLLSRIWWATNLPSAFTMFGISIPPVVIPTYSLVIGGGMYLAYRTAVHGSGSDLVRLGLVFFVVESVFEMFFMSSDIYDYWGPQPLEVFGFPLYWGAINSVGAVSTGVFVYAWREKFHASRAALVLIVPPLAFGADFAVGWPTWAVMDSTNSALAGSVASLGTIALCAAELRLAAKAVDRLKATGGPAARAATRYASATP